MEGTLDESHLGVRADHVTVGSSPEQHLHRIDNDGFSGSSFSSKDDEPGIQCQAQIVNYGKVVNTKFCQHSSVLETDPPQSVVQSAQHQPPYDNRYQSLN